MTHKTGLAYISRLEFFTIRFSKTNEAAQSGILGGYPVIDWAATIFDGEQHDRDSSERAFEHAARIAFYEAAKALAESIDDQRLNLGALFPDQSKLRESSARVAAAVIRYGSEQHLGQPIPDHEIDEVVRASMWFPDYVPAVPRSAKSVSSEEEGSP